VLGKFGSVFGIKAKHLFAASLVAASVGGASAAAAHTQCAPYAREVSGIDLHGAAASWWGEAAGNYGRGNAPKMGAVLAFRATHAMRSGHVAVVEKVVDARHVLLNHANWSGRGAIEHGAMAEDVSANGDWTEVRVWYAPIHALGLRASPTFGFIYKDAPKSAELALADDTAPKSHS